MSKVLVGMSGGIDSSVAAYLLKKEGHDVQGVTMTLWKEGREFSSTTIRDACFSPNEKKDVEKSQEICKKLGIRHTTLDIADLYEEKVLKNFKEEYLAGHTPNPCVICNQKIKFGAMVEYARKSGIDFEYFATGHYAKIIKLVGKYAIKQAADKKKDQSYFLYRLSQEQLKGIIFPLGDYTKKEIREMDVALGFHFKDQEESMDFYSGEYAELLDFEPKKGNIVDTSGKVLGVHKGYWNYTVGQRKGLGIGYGEPLYVLSINAEKNEVVVGTKELTKNTKITINDIVYMAYDKDCPEFEAQAKIRSTSPLLDCRVSVEDEDKAVVSFAAPAFSPALGQSVVVYKDDAVVLGGIIKDVD